MEPTRSPTSYRSSDLARFDASFFFLGLLNNVLYVVILSAALDLVPADVPKVGHSASA
jgi:battenin